MIGVGRRECPAVTTCCGCARACAGSARRDRPCRPASACRCRTGGSWSRSRRGCRPWWNGSRTRSRRYNARWRRVFGMDFSLHGSFQCRRAYKGQQTPLKALFSSSASSTCERVSATASSGVPAAQRRPAAAAGGHRDLRLRRQSHHLDGPDRGAVDEEVERERPGGLTTAVEDHADVAAVLDAHVAHDEVGPHVGLLADRRDRPLGPDGLPARGRASGSPRPPGSSRAPAGPGRSCRTCTCRGRPAR